MVDKEKVLKGLEHCSTDGSCRKCAYYCYGAHCNDNLCYDALELLKHDQETIESLQHTISELIKSIAE